MSGPDLIRILGLAALVVVVGWVCAEGLLRAIFRSDVPDEIGLPERALGAIGSFVALAVVLMITNLVTGGATFGVAAIVPVIGAGVLVYGLLRGRRPVGIPWLRVGLFAAVLTLAFIVPVLRGGTGARTGDTPWHLGWTEQLLGGQAIPTGPAPEARNAYPWGWHAVLATTARLVPGSDALDAHDAWHLLLVFALPLGAACIARRVRPDAGWGAAAAVALIGGFGWVATREPYLSTVPGQARHGADLTVASPNGAYALLPPALPRELALVLLALTGMLLVTAVRRPAIGARIAAGIALGLTGLISAPLFLGGAVWAAVCALRSPNRLRFAVTVSLAALLVVSLWAGPVAADFIRYGGFVDLTPRLGVEWALGTALGSWGLLLPLAAAGLWLSRGPRALVPWLCAATGGLLLAAALRDALGLRFAGNSTLLHQGRVWPVAHLLAAALAGVALAELSMRLSSRSRAAALSAGALLVGVGSLSVWLASARMTELLEGNLQGFTYDRPDLAPDAFARTAAARLSPSDVVRVQGDGGDRLAFLLWQLSGARLAGYDDPERSSNDLRIRYAELAERWDRRNRGGGFRPTVVIRQVDPPAGEYGNLHWSVTRF
ncbi:MAG TPA: hypothetical protein VFF07_16125 [Actinomycetota bacterium]|nr:hypothetical protein [Actinomycetota bacterium]